ncbi:gluconokinase [Methylobacterium sp. Leaf108]|uniref:gluconokinase n=1 Tax=Methylobacterium sp. Leaf108 TaxID=1736256 RepID=UPI0006F6DF0E|nr:gluconokinase [Methylobacterium sp. Leaf108]KQP50761.1 hypothetical protein ASF39_10910 [Methylobacterium sp. Leaf108]
MPSTLPPAAPARVLVVMGVSGCGKSTIAALLAQTLGWRFADGDAFHSDGNIARMRSGLGLGDAERAPWLAAIAAWIDRCLAEGRSGVIACSALRRAYRDALVRGRDSVLIVHLSGDRALIAARLGARRGHFMPPALLESQFADFEPPGPDENPIVAAVTESPDAMVEAILRELASRA